jgi:hypothetical protein
MAIVGWPPEQPRASQRHAPSSSTVTNDPKIAQVGQDCADITSLLECRQDRRWAATVRRCQVSAWRHARHSLAPDARVLPGGSITSRDGVTINVSARRRPPLNRRYRATYERLLSAYVVDLRRLKITMPPSTADCQS